MRKILKNIINDIFKNTLQKLKELVQMEQNYIWTDDKSFFETLKKTSMIVNIETISKLLEIYTVTVKKTLQNIGKAYSIILPLGFIFIAIYHHLKYVLS